MGSSMGPMEGMAGGIKPPTRSVGRVLWNQFQIADPPALQKPCFCFVLIFVMGGIPQSDILYDGIQTEQSDNGLVVVPVRGTRWNGLPSYHIKWRNVGN